MIPNEGTVMHGPHRPANRHSHLRVYNLDLYRPCGRA
jgi:hypothetical protein